MDFQDFVGRLTRAFVVVTVFQSGLDSKVGIMKRPKTRYLCWSQGRSALSVAKRATVNILADHGDGTYQIGTGILFRSKKDYYILTAAHVVGRLSHRAYKLIISSQMVGSLILGEDSKNSYPLSLMPNLDITWIRVPGEMIPKSDTGSFLCQGDLELEPWSGEGDFLLVGYPMGGCVPGRKGLRQGGWLQNHTLPLEMEVSHFHGVTEGLGGYDEKLHLLFSFQRRRGLRSRGPSIMVGFPDGLRGVSGSGVWKVNGKTKLVSIQTGFYERRRLIKSTKVLAMKEILELC